MEMRRSWRWAAALAIVVALLPLSLSPSASVAQGISALSVPVSQWADDFHTARDIAYGVAVDFNDNAIVVGTSGVVKYSPSGVVLWRVDYPDVAFDVATDAMGNVIVAGRKGLVKYTSEGQLLWEIPGSFRSVAVAFGDTIVAVSDRGVSLYDPAGQEIAQLAYKGKAVAAAVDPTGKLLMVVGDQGIAQYDFESREQLWLVAYPGEARDVAVDSEGGILVVGSAGVSKYGPKGVLVWQEPFLGEPYAVATFPLSLEERIEFEGAGDFVFVVGGHRTGGDWDYLTAKYAPTGKLIWDTRYDGRFGDDIAFGVAVSSAGYIYVTGTSTLVKSSGTTRTAQATDQDYYTIQYVERPLFDVMSTEGIHCPSGALSPTADFEVSPSAPVVGDLVEFVNRSSDPDGYLMAWEWDFGDGTLSIERDPTHTYGRSGTYPVTLTVVDNDYCVSQITHEVAVAQNPVEPDLQLNWTVETMELATELSADFTWTVEREVHGSYPLGFMPVEATDVDVIHFKDHSASKVHAANIVVRFTAEASTKLAGQIVTWHWDFGDGETSTEPSPTHIYATPGTYIVTLTVALANGQTATYEETVALESPSAEIVEWVWDFGDGNVSTSPDPTHHYQDDGTYTVTLTVRDRLGGVATAQKTITIVNVPPVADFSWTFAAWETVVGAGPLPTCTDLGLPYEDPFGYGTACGMPSMPSNAGVVVFQDLSYDSEPWFSIMDRAWTFTGGFPLCMLEAECGVVQNPEVLFLDETGDFLYRGSVDVTLTVSDEDGATGETTQTIEIANIPPYAIFDWGVEFGGGPALATQVTSSPQPDVLGGFASTDCDSCASTYGVGEPVKSASSNDGALTVTRVVYSECDLWGSEQQRAICGVWSTFYVEVTIQGTGIPTVYVNENVPSGWQITYCNDPSEALSCGPDHISGFVNVSGSFTFSYEAAPPWDTGNVTFGEHTISGTYASGHRFVSLSNIVILCNLVDVSALVYLWGYDDLDAQNLLGLPGIDPNGDTILDYDWNFGAFGTASGQAPEGGPCGTGGSSGECNFWFDDLTCTFDGIDWIWSYDLTVTLTVTDEAGGSTEASTTIPLSGPCGGGEGFIGPA